MTNRSISLRTLAAAALLAACGAPPPPSAPAPVATAPAQAAPAAGETLGDERAMELARGYLELLHAGEYERVWEHLAPEAKERFGTVERFRAQAARVLGGLGTEVLVVRESIEPARAGMLAHVLYQRISHYAGQEGTPVRLVIGLVNDGTIGGINLAPAQ